jgi:hypothetical protein
MSMIRSRWAAVGAAVAVTLGAGGVSLTQAAISSGEKPVFVSLDAPCRVVDTRSGSPIGAGDAAALTVQITGANGACTGALAIPADAVGVATNVTVIQPNGAASGRSYFTVYPNGATRPITSNLNFVNGQAPTPNKVDVGIGTGGQIIIYNNEGTAHAAVDIFGYYIDHNHDDRYYTEGEVDTALGAKADAADVYTKAEADAAHATKADAADVYTKTEVDTLVSPLFASITNSGGVYLGRAYGLVSSVRNSTGSYTLTFDRNLDGCAVASSDTVFNGTRDVSAEVGFGAADTVDVRVTNEADALEDTFFAVIIQCAPATASVTSSASPSAAPSAND